MKFFKRKKSSTQTERKIAPWKKWVARAGVVAMAVAATLLPAKQSVFAASIYKNYVGVYYNGTVAGMVSYDGTPAYCIQMESHMPAPGGYNGQSGNVYSTTATEAYSGLSSDLKKKNYSNYVFRIWIWGKKQHCLLLWCSAGNLGSSGLSRYQMEWLCFYFICSGSKE